MYHVPVLRIGTKLEQDFQNSSQQFYRTTVLLQDEDLQYYLKREIFTILLALREKISIFILCEKFDLLHQYILRSLLRKFIC